MPGPSPDDDDTDDEEERRDEGQDGDEDSGPSPRPALHLDLGSAFIKLAAKDGRKERLLSAPGCSSQLPVPRREEG